MTTERAPAWRLHRCAGGAQWATPVNSAINLDETGKLCTFNGCGCGSTVQTVRGDATREEASEWFLRP